MEILCMYFIYRSGILAVNFKFCYFGSDPIAKPDGECNSLGIFWFGKIIGHICSAWCGMHNLKIVAVFRNLEFYFCGKARFCVL